MSISPSEKLDLVEGCHHYTAKDQVPWDLQKYFAQRFSIFEYYDDGIYMTDDAWFGVTPEPIANQVAHDMAGIDDSKSVLIDLFAGAGGNTIAFALSGRWESVIAVERDTATLACAQHNADIYGVEEGIITWVHGDSFEFVDAFLNHPKTLHEKLRIDPASAILFASPPWGGPGYRTDEIFDLRTMQPYNLKQLHEAYATMAHALYLPRTSDIRQLAKLVHGPRKMEIVQYCMEGASKAMVAYIPGATNV